MVYLCVYSKQTQGPQTKPKWYTVRVYSTHTQVLQTKPKRSVHVYTVQTHRTPKLNQKFLWMFIQYVKKYLGGPVRLCGQQGNLVFCSPTTKLITLGSRFRFIPRQCHRGLQQNKHAVLYQNSVRIFGFPSHTTMLINIVLGSPLHVNKYSPRILFSWFLYNIVLCHIHLS